MSLIKAIKAQLGLSVTPANNFTLDASADNGTMKLARNSGQDIMTVDAAGNVAFPQPLATTTLSGTFTANNVVATTKLDAPDIIAGGCSVQSLDCSNPIMLAANGSGEYFIDLYSFSGLLLITDQVAGTTSMFLCGAGAVSNIGNSAGVVTNMSVHHNSTISGYTIINNAGTTRQIGVSAIRTRAQG